MWLGHVKKGLRSQAEEPGDLVLRVTGDVRRFHACEAAVR